MDDELIIVNGYIMNVTNAVQYAMVHKPTFQGMVKNDGFYRWYTEMVRYAEQEIRKECGIRELKVKAVWVGSGNMTFCWTFPDRYLRENRTEVEETQLKKLKKVARIHAGELRSFACIDGPEPFLLARLKAIPDAVYPLTGVACDKDFENGAITVDSLVATYCTEPENLPVDLNESRGIDDSKEST